MMKKIITLLLASVLVCTFIANAQMTDSQVVEYIKTAMASGKTESEIGKELLAKGVTKAQAERIKANYESGQQQKSVTEQALDNGVMERSTRSEEMTDANGDNSPLADMADSVTDEDDRRPKIFGHDIFRKRGLTFEPNENAATPEDYKLGPGDQLVIDIWGFNESNITQVISPEGRIFISQVGPVYLSGLTIKQASEKIRKQLATKYSGLEGNESSVSVTLGSVRTIQVNIMGEVSVPGTYRLSSFSTVFTALYRAGGVNRNGSMRAIKVVRGGKEIATVDIYGYLFEGKSGSDINLKEDDIIIVPTYVNLVSIDGGVKRPMMYELSEGETLAKLIDYAGGFASDAYRKDVNVVRKTSSEREVYTVRDNEYSSYVMSDGDEVTVGSALERFSNRVEIRGYVFRPGMFQLGGDIATVRQLVEMAGGLTEDAFLPRAVLLREKDNLDLETLSVNVGGIMDGTAEDVLLRKNDILVVSGIHELEDRGTLTINGAVANPGSFPFSDNTTVEDLILQAGGLLEGASTARVDISRRINDPTSTVASDTLGLVFSFPIKDGLAIDGGEDFILEPYDVVSVRMSPGFRKQTFVNVSGAINFPGSYLLLNKEEHVSELVDHAGGLTPQAYGRGARIIRRNTDGNSRQISKFVEKNTRNDSPDVDDLEIDNDYYVAIDLDLALQNPGSMYDVLLKDGDRIIIPEKETIVRVDGEVMNPTAVSYVPGKTLAYYINAAGGFSVNAKKNKAFIMYMNGSGAKGGRFTSKVEPGCTIIVPAKPEREKISPAELASVASASSSMVSVLAILANLFL